MHSFVGHREHPRYLVARYYWVIKRALLGEVDGLVQEDVIQEREDTCYLSFEELREAVCTNRVDYDIIAEREKKYGTYTKLIPPHVMTSEGKALPGEYDTGNIPKGALVGIPVSSGTVEGRAWVVLEIEDAHMGGGDILVTTFTDPSWTPVFVSIRNLVAEVGGTITHGSVITEEYGLPAVVGVENTTKLIKDGQRIRVSGTEGYVEILSRE